MHGACGQADGLTTTTETNCASDLAACVTFFFFWTYTSIHSRTIVVVVHGTPLLDDERCRVRYPFLSTPFECSLRRRQLLVFRSANHGAFFFLFASPWLGFRPFNCCVEDGKMDQNPNSL